MIVFRFLAHLMLIYNACSLLNFHLNFLSVLLNNITLSFGGFHKLSLLSFVETLNCLIQRAFLIFIFRMAGTTYIVTVGLGREELLLFDSVLVELVDGIA